MKARFEPAFPVTDTVIEGRSFEPDYMGMSLRDYFAAKAMQGTCASDIAGRTSPDIIASESYKMADAMLKAREAP